MVRITHWGNRNLLPSHGLQQVSCKFQLQIMAVAYERTKYEQNYVAEDLYNFMSFHVISISGS